CIIACWHGQFMMLAHLHPGDVKVSAMVARHGDAELIGEALRRFDTGLIRGAGAGGRKRDRGGASALRASVRALNEGASLVMTADVPPGPARAAGSGIITIARMSGRPIVPVAVASSRFKSFDTWSRMTLNLPYSKLVYVGGDPIHVPRDADDAILEALRLNLEHTLNAATERAYDLAGADVRRATPLGQLAAKNPPAPGLRLKLYRSGTSALRAAAPLLLKYRERQGKEDPERRSERLGQATKKRPEGPLAWVHAASVGETNAVLPLIEALLGAEPDLHVLLTTGTTTSAGLAARRLPPRACHQFVPLDAAKYAGAFLDHWRPDLAIFTESEIWPNLILESSRRNITMALINARMSPRSMKRWRRNGALARPLFSRFSIVLAQNEVVARTIQSLGAPNVLTVGNIKIDAAPPPANASDLAALKAAAPGRPLLLAASTHPGEETIVARAHEILEKALPGLLTIIAPRHPTRAEALQSELQSKGLRVARRSVTGLPLGDTQIYLADTIGELGTFFALCPVAFMGGSMIEHGGQNPIEAIRHGTLVLTGASIHNFRDIYETLANSGGAKTVTSAEDIAAAAALLLADKLAAAKMQIGAEAGLAKLEGALQKTLDALLPLISAKRDTSSAAS
ncbi:MAG: glycosyltransferase N-terminal domain-containing protein, partial [Parvularculaceae bacterium]